MPFFSDWMTPLGWFWLILIIIFIVTEIATLGLTTIWFAGGAVVGLVLNAAGVNWPVQVIVFLAISIALMLLVRPIARSYFNRSRTATNVDSMIGRKGIVTETIDNLKAKGTVSVDGMEWTARSADPEKVIAKEKQVEILSVEGNKLIVRETLVKSGSTV